jgi:hypothetical protein
LISAFRPRPGAHRLRHAEPVDHRQHAGHGCINQRDMVIGLAANSVDAPENSFDFDETWAWTSSPMMISHGSLCKRCCPGASLVTKCRLFDFHGGRARLLIALGAPRNRVE